MYIMTNRRNGPLYIGVTSDLARRGAEHRDGIGSQFVRNYYLKRLVYAEEHSDIPSEIQREKVDLIESANPEWNDLASAGP